MPPDRWDEGTARYVFRIEFRVEPAGDELTLDPGGFETLLYRWADPPGRDGWLFFRDVLWHGELSDPAHFRHLVEDALGADVTAASFSELQTDETYLDALREAVAEDLGTFRAGSVDEAVSKYLGSSIRVVPELERSRGR